MKFHHNIIINICKLSFDLVYKNLFRPFDCFDQFIANSQLKFNLQNKHVNCNTVAFVNTTPQLNQSRTFATENVYDFYKYQHYHFTEKHT